MFEGTMLYHTLDRSRWFIVPTELELPTGDLPVRSFSRIERSVEESALASHEVDAAAAKWWVDQRFEDSFRRAGDAFGQLASRVRAAGRSQGRTVPDVSGDRIRVEELLGVSAGELYTDPGRTKEAVDSLFAWASERLRPESVPAGQRPEIGETLRSLGAGLKAAAQRIEARRKEAESRRAHPQQRKLLRVGFFAELRHGAPNGPSLVASMREQRGPHEEELVRYLTDAPVLIASPGPVGDVLDPQAGYIGTRSIHTDGFWCWPADLPHYVRRYHLALPASFLEHLLARGWDPGQPDLGSVAF